LKKAHTILLVDWPSAQLPSALLTAGFNVYSYSPDSYSKAEFEKDGKLNFTKLDGPPVQVDIVNIFRPEEEHERIISKHAIPLGAKVIWLHPPVASERTHALAETFNLLFVQGVNIADVAADI